ncbi:fatty acyl-AMP ligase [Streptomyces sp. NPDC087440]|uniref:fatty acyl-AMP ligase n=1 Tax=Streptomyces sp. NPDC087440 TaxID=3365790 RepID=UPI0037FEDCA5
MVDLPQAASVAAVMRAHAHAAPDRTALVFVDDVERADGSTSWSYAQLDAQARRVGAWLGARCPVGTRVLLLYPSGFDFTAAYLGCLYAGAVAVPAPLPGHYRHEQQRVNHIARNAAASVVLTDSANLADVEAWAGAERLGARVVATGGDALPVPGSWSPPPVGPEDLAMLQYSSGTTGEPRGVMLSHGNLLHNADAQRRAFGLTRESRVGGWLPLYHDMGLLGQLLPALLIGATSVLMRPSAFLQRPHQWLQLIDRYDVHCSAAPNFAYELCLAKVTDEQLDGLDLSRWQLAYNGSERVDIATLDAFTKRFAPAGLPDTAPCPCYGMAEATVFVSCAARRRPVVTTVDAGHLGQRRFVTARSGVDLVSVGSPLDCEIRIVEPVGGQEVAPGGVGEIWLRGPSLGRAYWNCAPATEHAFGPDGFVRTGDLGALHEGELYVLGRVEEELRLAEGRLYPQDVERALRLSHPELAQAGAVFTVPADAFGAEDLVVVHEVQGRPAEADLRRLAERMRRTVAGAFGVTAGAVCLLRRGGVRRTTSGKIRRVAMRRLFLEGELAVLYEDRGPSMAPVLCLPEQDQEQLGQERGCRTAA